MQSLLAVLIAQSGHARWAAEVEERHQLQRALAHAHAHAQDRDLQKEKYRRRAARNERRAKRVAYLQDKRERELAERRLLHEQYMAALEARTCQQCHGYGRQLQTFDLRTGCMLLPIVAGPNTCTRCQGTGHVPGCTCATCRFFQEVSA